MKEKIFYYWIEKIIIFLAIVGTFFWINRFLPSRALTKNIYASHCYGEWLNPDRATEEPDLSPNSDVNEFNPENSAFYQTGFATLICDGFLVPEGEFISAKLGLSLAINELEESKKPIEEMRIEEKEESIEEIKIEEKTESEKIFASTDAIFNLRYVVGETPYYLSTFSSYPISNATHQGYFYFDLPQIKSFSDLEKLKISFEGLLGGEPSLVVWLDSVWLEIEYQEKPKVSLEVFQKFDEEDFEIFALYQNKEIQLTNNNFDDKFPNSDNEKEIVWQAQIDGRWQIFYLNLDDFLLGKTEPIQITKTRSNNISPKVSNGKIIWQAWLDNNWEIMFAEKDEKGEWKVERITKNQEHDMDPYFSQDEIFWQRKTKEGIKNFKTIKREGQWEIIEY